MCSKTSSMKSSPLSAYQVAESPNKVLKLSTDRYLFQTYSKKKDPQTNISTHFFFSKLLLKKDPQTDISTQFPILKMGADCNTFWLHCINSLIHNVIILSGVPEKALPPNKPIKRRKSKEIYSSHRNWPFVPIISCQTIVTVNPLSSSETWNLHIVNFFLTHR